MQYVDRLPDFICTEITHRQAAPKSELPNGIGSGVGIQNKLNMLGRGSAPETEDVIEERLTYIGKSESYEVIRLNGKTTKGLDHSDLKGAFTAGEFGSVLRDIFNRDSQTSFAWKRTERMHGMEAYVYSFRVPQDHGARVTHKDPYQEIVAAYSGLIFVDPRTFSVLRITSTLDLPTSFLITHVDKQIEYGPVWIATRQYWLPKHSETNMEDKDHSYRNEVVFSDYHKFAVESKIQY